MQFMTEEGPIKTICFDGYQFGDRLLEGVYFLATIENNDIVITVRPDCASYFSHVPIRLAQVAICITPVLTG